MILYFLAGFIGIIIATIMLGIESIFVGLIWLINQNREECSKIAIKMKNESSL